MTVNIFDVKPNKVSTDARSYSLLLVGQPKIGKSTFMHKLYGEKTLFIATEKRYRTMDGAYVQYVSNWADFIKVVNQLQTDKAKDFYESIVIDTLDNLQRYLDDFVANHYSETVIGEKNQFGAEFKRAEVIWERAMKKIENTGLNYGAVCHDKVITKKVPYASLSKEEKKVIPSKSVKDGSVEIQTRIADLDTRYNKHIEKSFDNVVFADYGINKAGDNVRVLYLRGGLHNGAKVTLRDVPDVIPFDVDSLQDTFKQSLSGYTNTTDKKVTRKDIKDTKYDYEELMDEAYKLSKEYVNLGRTEEAKKIVTDIIGIDKTVESLTPDQSEELSMVITALSDHLKELSE